MEYTSSPTVTFSIPGGLSSEEVYHYFGVYGQIEEVDTGDNHGTAVVSNSFLCHFSLIFY
jgi:hypothetical protein